MRDIQKKEVNLSDFKFFILTFKFIFRFFAYLLFLGLIWIAMEMAELCCKKEC